MPSFGVFNQSHLSLSETLSQSACIITGGSAHAATLADGLQKAAGALHMVRPGQSQLIKMLVVLMTAILIIPMSFPFLFSAISPSQYLQSPLKLNVSSTWVAPWWDLPSAVRPLMEPVWDIDSLQLSSSSLSPSIPDLHLSLPCMQESRWQSYFLYRGELAWLIECLVMSSYLLLLLFLVLLLILLSPLLPPTWQAPSFSPQFVFFSFIFNLFWAHQIPLLQTSSS